MINDPSYQFRLREGLRALLGSSAARGTLNSGRTLRELLRYGQDYASTEFQNEFNRNMGLANLGLGASQAQLGGANVTIPGIAGIGNLQVPQAQQTPFNLGGLGTYGSLMDNAGTLQGQGSNFLSQGIAGQSGAWQNALGGLGNLYGQGAFNTGSGMSGLSGSSFGGPGGFGGVSSVQNTLGYGLL